jgi:hypothetical protein
MSPEAINDNQNCPLRVVAPMASLFGEEGKAAEKTRSADTGQKVASAVALNWLAGSSSGHHVGAQPGRGSGPVTGQPPNAEDAFHDARVFAQREQPKPAPTARTVEHVDPNRAPRQFGPLVADATARSGGHPPFFNGLREPGVTAITAMPCGVSFFAVIMASAACFAVMILDVMILT